MAVEFATLSMSLVERMLDCYGLHARQYFDVQKGYRNQSYSFIDQSGRQLNLILYKAEPGIAKRIKRANKVANYLHEQGMPCRYTVDSRIIRLDGIRGQRFASLYMYLPGETISWEAYTKAHIKQLGAAMAQMHHVLQPADIELPSAAQEYRQIVERIRQYFADTAVKQALQQKLMIQVNLSATDDWQKLLAVCDQLPNKQALHMDFVRSNILFAKQEDQPKISGIIDFEKAAYGIPAFDIARTLAFLLVDCKYKPATKIRKYFLGSGYVKHGGGRLPKTTVQGKNIIDYLGNIFLLYDFYKFLRHNPYEFLEQNEHFVRTRDILVERGMLLYKARHTAITPEGTTS